MENVRHDTIHSLNSRQKRAWLHAARKAGIPLATTDMAPADTKAEAVPDPPPPQSRLRKMRKGAAKIISAAVTLLSLYILKASIAIEPYASTDPTRPFAQQFSVRNESVYRIYHVQPACGLPSDSGINIHNVSIVRAVEEIEALDAGDKTTLTCSIGTGPISGEMNLVPWVKYTIPIGIRRCKAVRFLGKPGADGTYLWTYHGSESCASD